MENIKRRLGLHGRVRERGLGLLPRLYAAFVCDIQAPLEQQCNALVIVSVICSYSLSFTFAPFTGYSISVQYRLFSVQHRKRF